MSFLEFASLLNCDPARIALLSTYQFDPDFFERRLLQQCSGLSKARRIVVFMDAGEWLVLTQQDVRARWLNQRYLVVPVRRPAGVFHPKLSLLLTEAGGQVLCGSNNITRSGCSTNLELLNSLPFEFGNGFDEEMAVASEAFQFFRRAAQDSDGEAGQVAAGWLDDTAAEFQWLEQAARQAETPRTVRLVHTYDAPLWNQLVEHLEPHPPDEFCIISPFHDRQSEAALQLAGHWPDASTIFVVQSGYTNLNVEPLRPMNHVSLHELRIEGSSRRAHAKALAWRSEDRCGCLAGSANFTSAALQGRNVEACLLIDSPANLIEPLFNGQVTATAISFDEFQPGTAEEPEHEDREEAALRLASAVLDEGDRIRVSYSNALADDTTSLRLLVRIPGEARPAVSVMLANRREGLETASIHQNALADARGTLLATLVAETAEGPRESNPIWMIQPQRLTYQPGDSSSASNSRIVETGEGLPEYLDELGRREGLAGVVEYLRRLSIRFDGRGRKQGARRFRIQIHDPHTADVVPEWLIASKADSGDLAKAIEDFNRRHERQRLRRHAESGNINGIENFLDIMRAMVRLTYVYYRKDEVPLTRGHFIDLAIRCIELATSGVDDDREPWEGFLYSMWDSLDGDMETLHQVLHETGYAAEVLALLLIARKVRCDSSSRASSNGQFERPGQVLITEAKNLRAAFEECEVGQPSVAEVKRVLDSYRLFSEGEIEQMLVELEGA